MSEMLRHYQGQRIKASQPDGVVAADPAEQKRQQTATRSQFPSNPKTLELVADKHAAATELEAETLRSALIDGAVDSYCKERGLVVRPEDIADRPDFRLVNTCETCDCPDPWCPTRGYHAEDGDD